MTAYASNPEIHPAGLDALVALIEKSVRGMDQKLGYHRKDRFVLFYYEPRGEEVVWRDSHSWGFSTGAGQLFIDELAPVADLHNVDVGSGDSMGKHVLLIDRAAQRAYFAERDEAFRFLSRVPGNQQEGASDMPDKIPSVVSLPTSVEITHEAIAALAHQIWEEHGRLEGLALRDWLQAEVQLREERWASRRVKWT